MQVLKTILPSSVNTDADEQLLKADEARYLRNYRITFNATSGGTNGGNYGAGTPVQSNKKAAPSIVLPLGANKCIGSYECKEVNKIFYFNYNSNKLHGIYMVDGDTMKEYTVIIDSRLDFSLDPAHAIAPHRVCAHVVYDTGDGEVRRIKEIYLTYTDGKKWQGWINVLAAIETEGFDAAKYPYFKVFAPHFDRNAFIEQAPRPPMYCPQVRAIAATADDRGRHNHLVKKSLRFGYRFIYTDGRVTTFSPRSTPFELSLSACNMNASNMPRTLELTLDAGCALVERVEVIVSDAGGDWYLVDTINKYTTSGANNPAVIGVAYWKRTNPFSDYSYDSLSNTFKYLFSGDREYSLIDQADVNVLSTDLPIASVGQVAAGDSILYGNNLYGYDNLSATEMDKLKLRVSPAVSTGACDIRMRTIKLYSTVGDGQNSFLWKRGETGDVYFGCVWKSFIRDYKYYDENIADQEALAKRVGAILKGKDGFIMYLAGTPYYTIGKQYAVAKDGTMKECGVIDLDNDAKRKFAYDHLNTEGYFVQVYEFRVPSGIYLARLAGHQATEEDDYRSTSTYVYGRHSDIRRVNNTIWIDNCYDRRQEMEINCTGGNADIWRSGFDILWIYAPTFVSDVSSKFVDGYVKESSKNQIPVEQLNVHFDMSKVLMAEGYKCSYVTDHNGFYWIHWNVADGSNRARNRRPSISGKWNCTTTEDFLWVESVPTNAGGIYLNQNVYIEDRLNTMPVHNRVLIKGRILSEDGTPLSGVAVTLTQGATTYTGTDGNYELVAHGTHLNGGVRRDKLFYNSSSVCVLTETSCISVSPEWYDDSTIQPCLSLVYREFNVTQKMLRVNGVNIKGLKGGGRYAIGIVGFDLAGRATFVNRIGYVDIPTFMDSKVFLPSLVSWYATSAVKLPDQIKYISFFISRNLNFASYLQWVGDKIEFIDITGKVIGGDATAGAIKAKITIQSLNDFNIENNFATTASYQFVAGDRVRIMDDGEEVLFDTATAGSYMDYDVQGTNWDEVKAQAGESQSDSGVVEDGKSFIIPYESRLAKLAGKKGFWIELQRPRSMESNELYYEICGTYPVIDGELKTMGATFGVWDTYYQRRMFHIKDAEGKSFIHPFEHYSVSDYWGERMETFGRVNVRDDKAEQKWYSDDVIKSDDIINEGRVNGLGTFRAANRKQFKGQEWGGIVGMHSERNLIAVICTNDWFLTDFQMNYAKVTQSGLIAANLDKNLGDPNQKVGSRYGCSYEHTASIIFEEGLAIWGCGAEGGVILMDYRQAINIAEVGNRGYLLDKWNAVNRHNASLTTSQYPYFLIDVIAGFDPKYKEYLITFRPRRGLSSKTSSFISNEREIKLAHQETFVFNIDQKAWVRWTGYAPEFYSSLSHARSGIELISFALGEPWLHNSAGVSSFNNFYGVDTDQVVDVVLCEDPKKVKIFQAVVMESGAIKYFIDRVMTSETGSFSYVPVSLVKRKEGVWYAELLRDMNTVPEVMSTFRRMLVDGKRIFGKWCRLRMVRDPRSRKSYSELLEISLRMIASENSGAH